MPPLFRDNSISWEGHFWGVVTGLVLALIYRNKGLPPKIEIDDDELEDGDEYWNTELEEEDESSNKKIKYYYPNGNKR